jgi:hypothetical protein
MLAERSSMLGSVASSSRSWVLILGALAFALGGAIALWAHYGTALFFEMIRTGLASCFG